jgi:MscS family membrane protein
MGNDAVRRGRLVTIVLGGLLLIASSTTAQIGIEKQKPETPSPAKQEATDPFNRDTPRGTIAGLNQAVHRHDFVVAAQYLQTTPAQRHNTEQLARDLTDLIDRFYVEPITALSDSPDGARNDALPPDRERVVLMISRQPVSIDLVRVKDPQTGLVWLISSQTLARIPELRRSADHTWLELLMPQRLVDARVLGVPIARMIAWAATLIIPAAILSLFSTLFIIVARRVIREPVRRTLLESWYSGLRWLVIMVLTLGIHVGLMPFLGFSFRFRIIYSRIALVIGVVALTWFLWRFMALSFAHARFVAERRGQASIRSLLMLAERVGKALLVLLAIFAFLRIAGVDTTTALAGVGLGGVAVALGAQKSVENLLGGVFLITDRALAVGDTCSISNRVGVVEDITMRSVRLRTTEQTLLSVPAGILSQSSLENFATRDKILVQSTLRLRYGTTADQLTQVLSSIRAMLDEHSHIETGTARIRLVDFGVRAIELELFAYVLTRDYLQFLAVREELLLRIAAIVESSGTSFAQPTIVHEELTPDRNAGEVAV